MDTTEEKRNWLILLFSFKGTLGRYQFLGLFLLANFAPLLWLMIPVFIGAEKSPSWVGMLYIPALILSVWIGLAALARRGRAVGWGPVISIVGYFVWDYGVKFFLTHPPLNREIDKLMFAESGHPILVMVLIQILYFGYAIILTILPDQPLDSESTPEEVHQTTQILDQTTQKGDEK